MQEQDLVEDPPVPSGTARILSVVLSWLMGWVACAALLYVHLLDFACAFAFACEFALGFAFCFLLLLLLLLVLLLLLLLFAFVFAFTFAFAFAFAFTVAFAFIILAETTTRTNGTFVEDDRFLAFLFLLHQT